MELRKNRKLYNEQYRVWLADQKYSVVPKKGPKISILMPTYNTDIVHLIECIESVQNQTYKNWELCIADDCSTDARVYEILVSMSKHDSRIKIKKLDKNGHICKATNEAFGLATGKYISLLDHDDILDKHALAEVVTAINKNKDAGLIYTDEDKLDKLGKHIDPFFKPDFSPYFLRSCNYITHFTTIRSDLFKKVGGFRLGTEGAQDWDLILRVSEISKQVIHIPKMLYSWRMSDTSTASNSDSKPYAYINQKIVLRDHMQRLGIAASVKSSPYAGLWNVFNHLNGEPMVSIIIPSKDSYILIKNCLKSIFNQTSYSNFEVIIVDTGTTVKKCLSLHKEYKNKFPNRFNVVYQKGKFNFSKACNLGAKHSKGNFILFLNNDTKIISNSWLEYLITLAQQPEVGAVGGKLFYAKDLIQHIGVHVNIDDVAHHSCINTDEKVLPDIMIYSSNIRECTAVTGACLMIDRNKFNKVGGFDEKLRVTYNDVDLCLKLISSGYKNIFTPYAKLFHYESKSVGKIGTNNRDKSEYFEAKNIVIERWGEHLSEEKYFKNIFRS